MEGKAFGRYRLLQLVGRGGMGEVWRAYDTRTKRTVAIKVLSSQITKDPTYEERFRREARAAARLGHPHIVPIHDFGEIDGRLFVDMRLVEGHDLYSELKKGPLQPIRALTIVEQIAKALNAAHIGGLVHRDVKPSNILIDADDFAYLIDFGIARAATDSSLTQAGSALGTWYYMSPERIEGRGFDARADVYALTCVLHECLTGARPFPGDSMASQVTAHLTHPPPKCSTVGLALPVALDKVIATGLAKNPDHRYRTTKDLATAARAAMQTHTPPAVVARPAPAVVARPAPQAPTPYPMHQQLPMHQPIPPNPPPPQYPPLPTPYFGQPPYQQRPRQSKWPWIAGAAAIAVVALIAGLIVIVQADSKPDITQLTSAMVARKSDFPTVSGGEFNAEPVERNPEYTPSTVRPAKCQYLIQTPRPDQNASARVYSSDETFGAYLQIDKQRPNLPAILDDCVGVSIVSDGDPVEVRRFDVDGLPGWAIATVFSYGTSNDSSGVVSIAGYHRGVYLEAWGSGSSSSSIKSQVVGLFRAQLERLDAG